MSWTHLRGASGDQIDLCLTLLGCFPISPANMLIEVEGKNGLTWHDVSQEMEFRNEKVE
jgi:hypothetical protein